MSKNLSKFGQFLKELRLSLGMSLRAACKATGYDPSNWSKIERGRIPPPSNAVTLNKWAKIFGLEKHPQKRQQFLDLANIAQGIIPQDLLSGDNAVDCLPAFFRTVRNKKAAKADIDKLIELIRNS